jgi:hypothetical protein
MSIIMIQGEQGLVFILFREDLHGIGTATVGVVIIGATITGVMIIGAGTMAGTTIVGAGITIGITTTI